MLKCLENVATVINGGIVYILILQHFITGRDMTVLIATNF